MSKKRVVSSLRSLLIRVWDPDYTRVTKEEKNAIKRAMEEIKAGEYYTSEEVFSNLKQEEIL